MMNKYKKNVHFPEKFGQTYASDPNIHRSVNRVTVNNITNPTNSAEAGNSGCKCQCQSDSCVPKINVGSAEGGKCAGSDCSSSSQSLSIPHKLVARLRQACSLADLNNVVGQCSMSQSLNYLGDKCKNCHHGSLDNLKNHCSNICDAPVLLLPAPPIYVFACEHSNKE
ncbi:hypothetical protein HF086_001701 [Spodoptera exigua]|uniref:Uncharacterized protein n=1 Tax=Spodoptera exigua TaxID=7107 RepID=A0A922MP53_SPOEX|nr:hypothetical protein HF086_001701 [Spodoptera exigua]